MFLISFLAGAAYNLSLIHIYTIGISSRDLAKQIPGAVAFDTLPEVAAYLREIAQPGDIIVTVGAGDIYKAGEMLLQD